MDPTLFNNHFSQHRGKNIKLNIYAYICMNVYTHTIYRHTNIDIHAHACIQKDAKRPKDVKAIK